MDKQMRAIYKIEDLKKFVRETLARFYLVDCELDTQVHATVYVKVKEKMLADIETFFKTGLETYPKHKDFLYELRTGKFLVKFYFQH